jgi:spore germination protein YaaH
MELGISTIGAVREWRLRQGRLTVALFSACLIALSSPGVSAVSAGPSIEMDREVFAFFDGGDRDYMLETADYDVLTTIAFFALPALADGRLHTKTGSGQPTSEWTAWKSNWMTRVIADAHSHGTKVILTVSRFGWTPGSAADTTALLADENAHSRLAAAVADEVITRGVDGVNLDLEPMFTGYQEEFVGLVAELRAALDARQPGLSLSFDVTGYSQKYPIAEAIAAGADAVFVMAYPYHTRNSSRAGAVSPMAGISAGDVTEAADRAVAEAGAHRVILGLPNYGMEWPTETRYLHSETRSNWSQYGMPRSSPISRAMRLAATHGRRWDSIQLVPWTRWRAQACSTCPATWRQLYYDDTQSMSLKYDFVNERDLLGVGVWQLGTGTDRPDFYDLLVDKFGQATQ